MLNLTLYYSYFHQPLGPIDPEPMIPSHHFISATHIEVDTLVQSTLRNLLIPS